jgi:multidrug efflux system membrane fusion protein
MSNEIQAVPTHLKRKKNRKLFIVGVIVIGVIGAIGIFALFHGGKSHPQEAGKAAPHAVPVTTTTVHQGNIGLYIEALGIVTPVHTVNAISRVQGQITQVNYQEGQIVHRGDSLIEIDSRPYEAALTQAQGQLERDQAALEEARIDLARYRKAYKRNAIPKQQLDDQAQLVLQDEGTVKVDQGTLENAQANLSYCHITSPIDGRVGLRLVDPGNMVQANSTASLVVITQLQPITVVFTVAEDNLPEIQDQLRKGNALQVEALDRTQEKKIATGKLIALDNQIDTTTGTVKLRAEFPNTDEHLFANQFVNAKLLVTSQDSVVVATPAIQRNAQGPFVYVIDADKTAEMRAIKVGTTDGNATAVTGVKPGEVVALEGFDKLQDGIKVIERNVAGTADTSSLKSP